MQKRIERVDSKINFV